MPMFDPVKDAIENSPVASTQQLPPTPSYKHNILSSPPTAPAAPPSPSRRNSVSSANLSMLLNDPPPPTKRQRTASIHHLLSPSDSRPSSSGGLQIDTGSSPGRSAMGPPPLPHRSSSAPTPVPYAPRRITPGNKLKVPLTPDEQAMMEHNCRNTLRNTATNSPRSRPSSSNGPERKRRRGSDDPGEIRPPPGVNGRDDSYMVAQHYNKRKEVGVKARLDSPIIGLRNFNNWIKSVLIAKFGRRPLQESNTHGPNPHGRGTTSGKVLDIGCGKGGDLRKWGKASIREYVGLDIAEVSISQARNRHTELVPSQRFDAEFHAFDCFSDNINTVVSPQRLRTPFDVVSMQFCMHYAFESLEKVRIMLENVSQYLRPGGIFLGTIPNSHLLLDTLNKLPEDETSFGNSVYSIRFDDKREQPLYGHRYYFYLKDAVEDVPEYVVRWEDFTSLAEDYGLKMTFHSDFHGIFASERRDPEYGPLLQTMKVVNHRGELGMSEDQWQAASVVPFGSMMDGVDCVPCHVRYT
ncbi:mRNA capping enzyme-domain-containing protein [Rhizoctonia solani]|nr:mRNA capping enzyme-domain-containing protein [Rhizoctonia solani]